MGIYLILFEAINGVESNTSVRFYVSKFTIISQHREQHEECLRDPEAPGHMYSFGRRARSYKVLFLCDLSKVNDKERDSVLLSVVVLGVSVIT
jgi:hypothetical protein